MHLGFSLLTLFPGRVGGSESYVRGLLGQFAAGNGPERVTVLANRHVLGEYDSAASGPVELRAVASYRAGNGMASRALAMVGARVVPKRAARDAPRDLDVLHYPVTVPIPALGVPTVVTIHDVSHLERRDPAGLALRAYRRWAYDGAARTADAVVATSRFAAGQIVEGMGVAEERVSVVPLGIDHATFVPGPVAEDEATLALLGLPERFLLYPANLWPHKNHRRLLEALARVGDRDLGLVLTGQGYGRGGRLAAVADRLGLGARVRQLGQVPAAALAALYRSAALTVIPSLHEGFGFPALEAMACGCVVASSGCGGLGEISGEAALLFDPEDPGAIAAAIQQGLADADLRARLIFAGRRLAVRYTWEESARRHANLYQRLA